MITKELERVTLDNGTGTFDGSPVFFYVRLSKVSTKEFIHYMQIAMNAYRYCEGIIYISPN
jgi:hypothetical protein